VAGSGFYEIEPAFDQRNVADDTVYPTRQIGILAFKEPDALLDFDQVGLDLTDIAADSPEALKYQIGPRLTHVARVWMYPTNAQGRGRRERESNP
jgi:hypothetical protein